MTDHDPRYDFSNPDLQAKYQFSDPAPVYWTADHAINMTIRDHFAAMAMKYMSLPTKVSSGRIGDNTWSLEEMENFPFTEMSRVAYRWADAMMEARKS